MSPNSKSFASGAVSLTRELIPFDSHYASRGGRRSPGRGSEEVEQDHWRQNSTTTLSRRCGAVQVEVPLALACVRPTISTQRSSSAKSAYPTVATPNTTSTDVSSGEAVLAGFRRSRPIYTALEEMPSASRRWLIDRFSAVVVELAQWFRPVFLAVRILSSTRAWARCRALRTASCSGGCLYVVVKPRRDWSQARRARAAGRACGRGAWRR
jgi:hypothetical protein